MIYYIKRKKCLLLKKIFQNTFINILLLCLLASCCSKSTCIINTTSKKDLNSCDIYEAFIGQWKTIELIEVEEGEPGPQGTEVSYPAKLNIYCEDNRLVVYLETQFNICGEATYFIDNLGGDIVFAPSFLSTKKTDSYSIIYHIKVFDETLHGITFGRVRLFEWRAIKEK